jgi:ABC-type antimicrobial peptide transport system permease subunit
VAIVNETFARKFLQGQSPVGHRIRQGLPGRQGPWVEIVGVSADAAYRSVRESVPPTLYVPLRQQKEPPASMSLSVRSSYGAPALLSHSVAESIGRVDSNIAITFTPLKQQVEAALVQERILAALSGSFGALALLLAGLGLYGMTWYAVTTRRTEIGIRAALGATPAAVARLMLSYVSVVVGIGIVIGLGMSWWATKLIRPLLFDVEPHDVVTLAWSVGLLVSVAAVAGWIPAHRASRIDPAAVLRST